MKWRKILKIYTFSTGKTLIYAFPQLNKNVWFLIIRSQNHILIIRSIFEWVSDKNQQNKFQKLRKINEKFEGGIIKIKCFKNTDIFLITLYEHGMFDYWTQA